MSFFKGQQILLMTALTPGSGYGADGVALAQLLELEGAVVHLDPSAVGVPLPMDVAKMLARPRPANFDMALTHADPMSLHMPAHVANRIGRTVAWTMWEFGSYLGEEFEPALSTRLQGFDDVLGYTDLTTKVTAPYAPQARHGTIMGGYQAGLWEPKETTPLRRWDADPFRYGMVITNQRKGWPAALSAFLTVKEEHPTEFRAELHLKTNQLLVTPQIHDPRNGVYVHHEAWSHEQMLSFYGSLHCLVAPSMGEGKHLPPLEAATTGCPSILSACAGHTDWASDDIAYLVPGVTSERDPVRRPGQTAFYVDDRELADAMWAAYRDRATARLKGEQAASMVPAMLDWPRVLERVGHWLEAAPARPRPIQEIAEPADALTAELWAAP